MGSINRRNMLGSTIAIVGLVSMPIRSVISNDSSVPDDEELWTGKHTSRAQFAGAMSKIKEGMTQNEVVELIGLPNDKRTKADKITLSRTTEIWRYGTNGHLTAPTLGSVAFAKDKVQYIWGNTGTPPSAEMFSEPELRKLLRILDAVPSYNDGQRYDPTLVVRAVNALQSLGKQKALLAMRELIRTCNSFESSGYEGLFIVLRTLFELPAEGEMPDMYVGAMMPAPISTKSFPRFPTMLVGDLPLWGVMGYMLAGRAQSPRAHVDYFETHGDLRRTRLEPSNDAMASLVELIDSKDWCFKKDLRAKNGVDFQARLLQQQVMAALSPVYKLDPKINKGTLPYNHDGGHYQRIIDEVIQLNCRWHHGKGEYVAMGSNSK